jgi:hypothetical protein
MNLEDKPFYGAFEQRQMEWFQTKENSLNSLSIPEKIFYYGRNYDVQNEQYLRTDSLEFYISPKVNNVFDNSTKSVKEIHYEWDILNHLFENEKNNIRILSNSKADEFISYYIHLKDIISDYLGNSKIVNELKTNQTINYDSFEVSDTWENNLLICNLDLVFSNTHFKKGLIETKPTHRIRCEFYWK